MTTNGKCKRCGSPIKMQKYWKHTANLMRIISSHKNKGTPLEINDRIYFVPDEYFQEFDITNGSDWKQMAMIVEKIKRDCINFVYKS